jgi:hypothetical protein
MTIAARAPRARRAAPFTQRDLVRALKAALAAGLQVAEVLVARDGDIRLIFSSPGAVAQSDRNEWDD